jgi:beta-glucanase (GH16 family)
MLLFVLLLLFLRTLAASNSAQAPWQEDGLTERAVQWKWQTCNQNTSCPASQPCCRDGSCGATPYFCSVCLPNFSHPKSCFNRFECVSYTDDFTMSRITSSAEWDGNPETTEWISLEPNSTFDTTGDGLKLTMKAKSYLNPFGRIEGQGVSLLSSRWMHYGTVESRIKASPGAGIVTALFLKGNDGGEAEDEIDFEWIGLEPSGAWSNYFWFGELKYNQGLWVQPSNVTSVYENTGNTSTQTVENFNALEFHNYKIEWFPDRISWYIDNIIIRNVYRNQTEKYPTRESRVVLSLWDGGQREPGTTWWAKGPSDWSESNREYVAEIEWIKIDCYHEDFAASHRRIFTNETSKFLGMTWNGINSQISMDGTPFVNNGKLDVPIVSNITLVISNAHKLRSLLLLLICFM